MKWFSGEAHPAAGGFVLSGGFPLALAIARTKKGLWGTWFFHSSVKTQQWEKPRLEGELGSVLAAGAGLSAFPGMLYVTRGVAFVS